MPGCGLAGTEGSCSLPGWSKDNSTKSESSHAVCMSVKWQSGKKKVKDNIKFYQWASEERQ